MEKYLIVDDDPEILEILSLFVESEFEVSVLTAESGNIARDLLINESNISLIISDFKMNDGTGADLYQYLSEERLDIPFILLTGADSREYMLDFDQYLNDREDIAFLEKPFDDQELTNTIKELLKKDTVSDSFGYKRINIDHYEKFSCVEIDIYVQRSRGQFSKIVDATEGQPLGIKEKFKEKGVESFYTTIEEYELFSIKMNYILREKLNSEETDPLEKIEIQLASIDQIHGTLKSLGMTERTLELAHSNVETCMEILSKTNRVAHIVGKLLKRKNYIYELAIMTSYISSAVASYLEWSTPETMKKLAMAALLMDAGLDDEEEAKIVSLKSEEFKNLDKAARAKVHNHMLTILDKVEELEVVSNDISQLITFHHERPDGTGFPKQQTRRNFSPLICIFIMSHEFAHRLLTKPLTRETLEELLADFEENYSKGVFKRPYDAFIETFRQKDKMCA